MIEQCCGNCSYRGRPNYIDPCASCVKCSRWDALYPIKLNEREIMSKAIAKWGADKQISKAIEECGELIVELARQESRRNIGNIAEEVVDVRIMLDQLEMIFHLDTTLIRQQKMERLSKRL